MNIPKSPPFRCLRSISITLRPPKPTAQSNQIPRYTKGPPPYPYGPATHYKQSDSGLYGGATLQFGNLISSKNAHKSRRIWRPNIHNKRLWSEGLGRFVQVKVLARVLRTIDKCGGLDGYLLGEKSGRVKELGVEGWRLRWMVMRTGKVRRRIRGVKGEMGLLTMGRKDGELTRGVEEGLEHEVERTSEEVIERIENSNQARSEIIETTLAPPPSEPTPLESHINLTTLAIEAETARQSQPPTPGTNTPPSHSNPADESPPEGPSRRFTKGEKRAWRASHRNPPNSDHVAESTLDGSASALMAEVARIEGAVEGEMAAGMEKEGRERLEAAMEMLRRAAEELERVKGEGRGMGREKGAEGGKGGVLGRIRGLLWRG